MRDRVHAVDRLAGETGRVLRRRHVQVGALRLRVGDLASAKAAATRGARIAARLDQPHELRVVELDDARRADGLVIGDAQAYVVDRRVLDLELVRVGLEPDLGRPGAAGVIRIAVAGIEQELLGEGHVLDEEHGFP